ncbi:type IX secretion system protein PorD [Dyadobacter sp. OTU695]|uniref:type IX secretion system protein PorD n=1 Tax=Dyadobacter sp. OTU695 TaxID=3043860 RepID=UPI00313C68D2
MERSIKLLILTIPLLFGALAQRVYAQEFQFTVNLNYEQLVAQQKTDPQSMNQLQTYMNDFLNNTRWTNDQFAKEEKIKCKLNVNLTRSLAQGSYEGNAQLVVSRPVYGSTYETVLFTYVDKNFTFTYLPSTQLYFNENSYTEELPYMLAFYANIALIFDYDSFSKMGGSPYVQKAFNLVNLARNSSPNKRGWDSNGDSKNRYWLIENLQSQQFTPFREGMYKYYRQGLDVATQNPVETRAKVLEFLNTIKEVNQLRPASVVVNSFFDAKSDELYRILIEGLPEQRAQAYSLLVNLDPSKTQLYQRLSM